MNSSAAFFMGGAVLVMLCAVPLAWAWVARSERPVPVYLRRHPRIFVSGALFGWACIPAAAVLQMPLLAGIGSAATLGLTLGIIILFGEKLAQPGWSPISSPETTRHIER